MLYVLAEKLRKYAMDNATLLGLKTLIIAWCLCIIIVTIFIEDKWILTGILAYEVLP